MGSKDKPDEIPEITPEMIEAGVQALVETTGDETPTLGHEETVGAIFRAMRAVELKTDGLVDACGR
jgi:hypothetical protein